MTIKLVSLIVTTKVELKGNGYGTSAYAGYLAKDFGVGLKGIFFRACEEKKQTVFFSYN